jgi:Ni,Fe-hydrogenase maturation factor
MRRGIGTVVVTELAVVALVNNPVMISQRQFCDMTLICIDAAEQRGKRGTQVETAPAAVANFINAECFFVELHRIDWMNQLEALHISPDRKQSAVSHQQ